MRILRNIHTIFISILLLALSFVSCSKESRYFSDGFTPAQVEILRFDTVIANLPTDSVSLTAAVRKLMEESPEFMNVMAEYIMGINADDTATISSELYHFVNDTIYGFRHTLDRVKLVSMDFDSEKESLNNAFGRLLSLYPDAEIPKLMFCVTGFQFNMLMLDDCLCVGSDMYLGSDYEYYNRVVYDYQKRHMNKENIAGDVVLYTLYSTLFNPCDKRRLLESILFSGRILFLMQQLMPERHPAYIIGYTEDQWKWCERNERAIWGIICDKQDLFSSSPTVISSYTSDGPFTSEISQDAPPMLGTWIGWRIIDSYMRQHPQTTLQQMMQLDDAQIILQESKYKP